MLDCFDIFILIFRMTTESFEVFADRFMSDLTSHFIKVDDHKVKITSDTIKVQIYFLESGEEIDVRALYVICNDVTKKTLLNLN